MDKLFFKTNTQKTLDFLISAGNGELERAEIEKKTRLSKAGVNFALKELVKFDLAAKKVKGRSHLYKADFSNPVVKQLKSLKIIIQILPLIKKISRFSQKVVLFGSSSRGENLPDSDVDLFILSRNKEAVKEIIKKSGFRNKIQAIIKTPVEFAKMEKNDQIGRASCRERV